jgi:hypothetical protein
MSKIIFALTALATVSFAGVGFAAPDAPAPTVMTNAEMDKVTAGFGFVEVPEAASRNGFLVNQNLLPPGPCAEHCIGLDRALDRAAQPARN